MPSEQNELQRTLENLNKTVSQFREHNDKAIKELGARSDEQKQAADRANEELTKLREKYNELAKKINRQGSIFGQGHGETAYSEDEQKLRNDFFKFVRSRGTIIPENQRDLIPDSKGSIFVPTSVDSNILRSVREIAEIRPRARVSTIGGDNIVFPSLKNLIVSWGDRELKVTDEQRLEAGHRRATVAMVQALVIIPNNLLDDSAVDLEAEVSNDLELAFAESEDEKFTVGNGVDEPEGFATNAAAQARYTPSGVAAALTDATNNGVDALIDMQYAIKKSIRQGCVYGMNSNTEAVIRKLKDDNGNYLWQPPVQAGRPASILGYPLINPEFMDDIGADKFPAFFGNLRRGYRVIDRAGTTLQVLTEKHAYTNETAYIFRRRTTGKVIEAQAFQMLKIAAS